MSISVIDATGDKNVLSTDPAEATYAARIIVSDPSGVDQIVVEKFDERETVDVAVPPGATGYVPVTITVTGAVNYGKYALEAGTIGPSLTITAIDEYGNEVTADRRGPSGLAMFARVLSDTVSDIPGGDSVFADFFVNKAVERIAMTSGFTYSIGEGVVGLAETAAGAISGIEDLVDFLLSPDRIEKLVEAFDRIWQFLQQLSVDTLKQLLVGLAKNIQQSQQVQNPFEPTAAGSLPAELRSSLDDLSLADAITGEYLTDNATFAMGWYGGYLGGKLIFELVGDKGISTFVRKAAKYSDTVETAVKYSQRAAGALKRGFALPGKLAMAGGKRIVRDVSAGFSASRLAQGLARYGIGVQQRIGQVVRTRLDDSTQRCV